MNDISGCHEVSCIHYHLHNTVGRLPTGSDVTGLTRFPLEESHGVFLGEIARDESKSDGEVWVERPVVTTLHHLSFIIDKGPAVN